MQWCGCVFLLFLVRNVLLFVQYFCYFFWMVCVDGVFLLEGVVDRFLDNECMINLWKKWDQFRILEFQGIGSLVLSVVSGVFVLVVIFVIFVVVIEFYVMLLLVLIVEFVLLIRMLWIIIVRLIVLFMLMQLKYFVQMLCGLFLSLCSCVIVESFGVLVMFLVGNVVVSSVLIVVFGVVVLFIVFMSWCMVGQFLIVQRLFIWMFFGMYMWERLLCIRLMIMMFFVCFLWLVVSFVVSLVFCMGLVLWGCVFLIGWVWMMLFWMWRNCLGFVFSSECLLICMNLLWCEGVVDWRWWYICVVLCELVMVNWVVRQS